jgi:glycosyltransferase involved in cell wall biosynthesis
VKLSIIIPVYNSEKYIEKCLKSIFKQSHQDFEVIVVDGYSKDKSPKILQGYLSLYPKKFYLAFRKPQGEPDAVNAGMEMAVGDIVAYIDSDDTYEPKCFERVVKVFERNPDVSWLYGKGNVIDEYGHETRGIVTAIKNLFWPIYSYGVLQCFNYIVQPTVFMRKSFHDEVGRFNTCFKYDFDYEYWLRAGLISPPFFLNKHLANWRAHSGSLSVKEYKAEAMQVLEIQKEYSEWWMRPIQWKINWLIILLYWVMKK